MFMTREDPYRVQAERQRKRIARIEEQEPEKPTPSNVKEELPSRRSIHHKNKKKKKKNQKYTGMTILAVSFIALPVLLLGIHEMISRHSGDSVVPVNSSSNQFEQIGVEQKSSHSAAVNITEEDTQEATEETAKEPEDSAVQEEKKKAEAAKQKAEAEAAKQKEKEEAAKAKKEQEEEKKEAAAKQEKAAASEAEKQEPAETTKTENAETATQQSVIYHTVAANETLYRIAMKYYNSKTGIDIIKQANQLTGDNLMAGQVLKIPQ